MSDSFLSGLNPSSIVSRLESQVKEWEQSKGAVEPPPPAFVQGLMDVMGPTTSDLVTRAISHAGTTGFDSYPAPSSKAAAFREQIGMYSTNTPIPQKPLYGMEQNHFAAFRFDDQHHLTVESTEKGILELLLAGRSDWSDDKLKAAKLLAHLLALGIHLGFVARAGAGGTNLDPSKGAQMQHTPVESGEYQNGSVDPAKLDAILDQIAPGKTYITQQDFAEMRAQRARQSLAATPGSEIDKLKAEGAIAAAKAASVAEFGLLAVCAGIKVPNENAPVVSKAALKEFYTGRLFPELMAFAEEQADQKADQK
jgi:hypothetical protein